MTLKINGRIKSSDSDATALDGYRVEMFFEQKISNEVMERRLPEKGVKDTVAAKLRVSARTDSRGLFKASLPDSTANFDKTLHFLVSGPAGQLIGDVIHDIKDIAKEVVIPVSTKDIAPIPLEIQNIIPKDVMRRITGLVLDRMGKLIPANTQVLLFARKIGDTGASGTDIPVLVARTDRSGYFFGEVPKERYERAAAIVAGLMEEIAVGLDDGLIPAKLVLHVELPESAEIGVKTDNCCSNVTPRTPSHADIENAPDTYSTDLGTGRCVQFNAPNRAIEEFDFYTVVRTTEPDIIGFTSDSQTPRRAPGSEETLAALAAIVARATAAATAANALAASMEIKASQARAGGAISMH